VPGGKYYWRVKVSQVNALNYSSKTAAPVSFGVKLNETTGDITFLMSPGPGDTGVATKPTFQWTPVTGATGYDLQVSDNPVFVNPIDDQKNLATNVWTLTKTLDNNKVYYWRVRAVNGNTGVVGDWVQQTFTTVRSTYYNCSFDSYGHSSSDHHGYCDGDASSGNCDDDNRTSSPDSAYPSLYLAIVIAIGAILVIAVIVLIARTRRV
jgi:hypothetical protein